MSEIHISLLLNSLFEVVAGLYRFWFVIPSLNWRTCAHFFKAYYPRIYITLQWWVNILVYRQMISTRQKWFKRALGGGTRVVVSTAAFHARVRGSIPSLGGLKETEMFLTHPRVKVSIVGSLRNREVACSASDRQGSNFESCVWRTVSSHHPQEVLLAQFSLYVHKGGLKPDSFHFQALCWTWGCITEPAWKRGTRTACWQPDANSNYLNIQFNIYFELHRSFHTLVQTSAGLNTSLNTRNHTT